ncbi:MAG: UDP binding domain-containing protein, partial [Cyanobacteria bacterium J06633_2]
VKKVAIGMGLDSRIGHKFLQAGIGWGGSCFPKDVSALIHTAKDYGYDAPVLTAAVQTNHHQRRLALEKLCQVLKILKGKTIGLLGLTFKPNTDDMRDAPALDLIHELHRLGAKIHAFDPIIQPGTAHDGLAPVTLMESPEAMAVGCDALVLVTDWPEFQTLNYAQLVSTMRTPLMIDGRNCLNATVLTNAGFYYIGIGRPAANPQASSMTVRSSHSSNGHLLSEVA